MNNLPVKPRSVKSWFEYLYRPLPYWQHGKVLLEKEVDGIAYRLVKKRWVEVGVFRAICSKCGLSFGFEGPTTLKNPPRICKRCAKAEGQGGAQ